MNEKSMLIDLSVIYDNTMYVHTKWIPELLYSACIFLFPCTISLVVLRVVMYEWQREREKEKEGERKNEKNGYESLSAMSSSVTIRAFCIHKNDDDDDYDDDGRRSGVRTHSSYTDEMFIFTSSECKSLVYLCSQYIKKREKRSDRLIWDKKESELAF